jgi:hypothetical protein
MKIENAAFELVEKNKRVQPKGIEAKETPTHKTGIKVYNKCAGWFLSLFGFAVRIKDADNKIWYVNKNSLRGWGKCNSGEENFKLRNLDQLLKNIKNAPKSSPLNPLENQLERVASPSPSLPYTPKRIGKELWLKETLLVSQDTVQRVNQAADYLQNQGFELVGVAADGNCLFQAFLTSYQDLNRKIPILDLQENKIEYLRDLLSKTYGDEDRGEEIKEDRVFVSANEAERLSAVLYKPIRFITPIEGGDTSDMLARKGKETQDWNTLEEKPKTGDYIVIVDLGGHFITARPSKMS